MACPLQWPILMQGSPRIYLRLIYINDLPYGLSSNPKLLADDTSLFSVVHICYWVKQWPEKNQWLGLSMENDFQSRS